MLLVGSKAPDFVLDSTTGEVQLNNIQNKVLLIFYPRDNTPGCTRQLCAAQDNLNVYTKLGVSVVGINYGSLESHKRFSEKYSYTFPICVDKDKIVTKQYEALTDEGKVIRTVYLIDEDKVIRYAKQGLPSTDELLEAIDQMR